MILKAFTRIMSDKDSTRTPFWKNVARGDEDECWEWKGDVDIFSGFGISTKLVSGSEVVRMAHRIAYILTYGPVPTNHVIRHTCRNQTCCNPAHLIAMRKHPEEEDENLVTLYFYSSRRAPHLSEFEKRRIVTLRAEGFKIRELAQQFGVSSSTISRTIRGLS